MADEKASDQTPDNANQHPATSHLQNAMRYLKSALDVLNVTSDVPMPKGLKEATGGDLEAGEKTLTGVIGAVPVAGVTGLAKAGAEAAPTIGAVRDIAGDAAEIEKEIYAATDAAKVASKAKSAKEVVEGEGLVYKGELSPGSKVHMFEHPEHPGKTAALNEEDVTPKAVREKMGSKLKEFANPPSKSSSTGTVRVYHGEGGQAGAGGGGGWASTNPERAGSYGGKVNYTDLSQEEFKEAQQAARKAGSGTSGDVVLKPEQQARAKSTRIPSQRTEVTPSSSGKSLQEQGEAIWGSGLKQQPASQSGLRQAINQ